MMGGFEQLYFGQNPQSTKGKDFMSARNHMFNNGPGHATIVMPIDFEASTSLKADSVFVSVNNNSEFPQVLSQARRSIPTRQTTLLRQSITDLRGSKEVEDPPLRLTSKITVASSTVSQKQEVVPQQYLEREVSLGELEKAINEINDLNNGEIPQKSQAQKMKDLIQEQSERADYLKASEKTFENEYGVKPEVERQESEFDPGNFFLTQEAIQDA